jgi:hypothetical protein
MHEMSYYQYVLCMEEEPNVPRKEGCFSGYISYHFYYVIYRYYILVYHLTLFTKARLL